jgi:nitroimidazol reductase NimA-like FMN-containing flavoprotein (pyridoxamine 5'-phosphate oxidase superfamily)
MTNEYAKTDRTTPSRLPERATYEADAIHAVLDEALLCHVAYVSNGLPKMIPTLHVRQGSDLFLHGSTGSSLMLAAREAPVPVCVTVTLVDGIVMAKSWFNHSMNYRSVIVHGEATLVTDADEKNAAMVALMEQIAEGRAEGSRYSNKREFAATAILRLPLTQSSLKRRSGLPKDDAEDLDLPHWSGVIPITTSFGEPIGYDDLPLPDYLKNYSRGK